MEKGTPHCKLTVVKRLIGESKVRMTRTALVGAATLGFDAQAVIEVVKTLGRPTSTRA
jgi:motility quorum-sensing regulator/GCU-specific mRNA interferase toxin